MNSLLQWTKVITLSLFAVFFGMNEFVQRITNAKKRQFRHSWTYKPTIISDVVYQNVLSSLYTVIIIWELVTLSTSERLTNSLQSAEEWLSLTNHFFPFHLTVFFWRENVNENELQNCTHIRTYVNVIHFEPNNVHWHFYIYRQWQKQFKYRYKNMNEWNKWKKEIEKAHLKHRKRTS